jgi:hypothetical protein
MAVIVMPLVPTATEPPRMEVARSRPVVAIGVVAPGSMSAIAVEMAPAPAVVVAVVAALVATAVSATVVVQVARRCSRRSQRTQSQRGDRRDRGAARTCSARPRHDSLHGRGQRPLVVGDGAIAGHIRAS